ncbi:MAG: HvfC/BufC N-terminal domain-containing protein [Hyphomicrobiaceae bacterium]
MPWPDAQRDLAERLRNPNASQPEDLAQTTNSPSSKRFNVYRNNMTAGLVSVLRSRHPVVAQLVGAEFFTAMARVFVTQNAPVSPVMHEYGAGFADFIETFEPAAGVPYLADVGRIEWAWGQAYNAPDAEPIGIEALQAVAPARMHRASLRLHPSLRILRSDWPVVSIWQAHQMDDDPISALKEIAPEAEWGMIVRPHLDVDVRLIPEATWSFCQALQCGAELGVVAGPLLAGKPTDLAEMLQLLFATGAVIGVDVS